MQVCGLSGQPETQTPDDQGLSFRLAPPPDSRMIVDCTLYNVDCRLSIVHCTMWIVECRFCSSYILLDH